MKPIALYLHVPFCASICPYCAFYKRTWDADLEKGYLEALKTELVFYAQKFPNLKIGTVFWGGGTPNLLKTVAIRGIMDLILQRFDCVDQLEVSMEINPGLSSQSKLAAIRAAGVNRFSLGIQSFLDSELEFLGRAHRVKSSLKAIEVVKGLVDNFSIDLMIGFPNQSMTDLAYSVDQALAMNPPHMSVYSLSIEPGTKFAKNQQGTANQDQSYQQLKHIYRQLSQQGYRRYEFSNFAKPGYECKHNLAYWTYQPYIGCGPGAHSFFLGNRFKQARDLQQYIQTPIHRIWTQKKPAPTPLFQQINDYLLTGLRLEQGISHRQFDHRFHIDSKTLLKEALDTAKSLGLLRKSATRIQTTQKGSYLLNAILGLLCLDASQL